MDPKSTRRLQGARAADIRCAMWEADKSSTAALARAGRQRRAWPDGVTIALRLAALCFVLGLAAPAHAQSPLIQGWLAVNAQCKGGPADDPKVQQACKTRDRLNERLKRRGCSYQADGDWWRCPH